MVHHTGTKLVFVLPSNTHYTNAVYIAHWLHPKWHIGMHQYYLSNNKLHILCFHPFTASRLNKAHYVSFLDWFPNFLPSEAETSFHSFYYNINKEGNSSSEQFVDFMFFVKVTLTSHGHAAPSEDCSAVCWCFYGHWCEMLKSNYFF